MIRLFIMLVILVAIVASQLHVSSGVAWVIVLAAVAVVAVVGASRSNGKGYVNMTAALGRCPYCRKTAKLGATACHHCGRSLVVEGPQSVVDRDA